MKPAGSRLNDDREEIAPDSSRAGIRTHSIDRTDSRQNTRGMERTHKHTGTARLYLAAVGVVFGDIGTSPIYAIREAFHPSHGVAVTPVNVIGVLSLIFWALVTIVSIKYLSFFLRADNQGEGGVLALTALLKPKSYAKQRGRRVLIAMGLFGSALLYGDGMITPAISVLSAVEGIRLVAPGFGPYVLPATVAILAGLFLAQKNGTARVGVLFGPIILLWLFGIAALGLSAIAVHPSILAAVSPWHGIVFLTTHRLQGFVVLGAVFLVVTGAEALYADLGHFGKRPIRMTWMGLVLPALLLNYFGQGALLMARPEEVHHPFFALAPSWALLPLVILATMSTIIASQAVITGAFSLTRQAMQLGYLPRMKVVHTSVKHIGQIFVAPVNWLLMVCTIGLVLSFGSSSQLAAAYGVAVTATMMISSILFYAVAREKWAWGRAAAGLTVCLFLTIETCFFTANITKIAEGAWFPLAVAGSIFTLMTIWKQGRDLVGRRLNERARAFETFQQEILSQPPQRVNGQAVFLTGNPGAVPPALTHNLHHNKVLHSTILLLTFATDDVPRVPNDRKVQLEKLGNGFYRVIARYGFMEDPHMPNLLALIRERGLELKTEALSFFLGRMRFTLGGGAGLGAVRNKVFAFMARNAAEAAAYYGIPAEQVLEVGTQFQL